jgi:hypothetical protein
MAEMDGWMDGWMGGPCATKKDMTCRVVSLEIVCVL